MSNKPRKSLKFINKALHPKYFKDFLIFGTIHKPTPNGEHGRELEEIMGQSARLRDYSGQDICTTNLSGQNFWSSQG